MGWPLRGGGIGKETGISWQIRLANIANKDVMLSLSPSLSESYLIPNHKSAIPVMKYCYFVVKTHTYSNSNWLRQAEYLSVLLIRCQLSEKQKAGAKSSPSPLFPLWTLSDKMINITLHLAHFSPKSSSDCCHHTLLVNRFLCTDGDRKCVALMCSSHCFHTSA